MTIGLGVRFSLLWLALFCDTAAAQAPVVQRAGSTLNVRWQSKTAGHWRIIGSNGQVCTDGAVNVGENHIELDKIASVDDLELIVTADKSDFHQHLHIPADVYQSPLEKPLGAVVIYQLPVRTYLARSATRQGQGRFDDLDDRLFQDLRHLGVDYIWLTGALEYASPQQTDPDGLKGNAGSYYALRDMWDAADDLGGLEALERLIKRSHRNGIRILLDLIPNHTARVHETDVLCRQYLNFGDRDNKNAFFDRNNNYYYIQGSTFIPPSQAFGDNLDGIFDTDPQEPGIQLESPAKVTGNDVISPSPRFVDWFETAKLNYGYDLLRDRVVTNPKPRTWIQMRDVASYWLRKGVDGFRIDFSHVIPVEFWPWFVGELREVQPDVFLVAEAYEGARIAVKDSQHYSEQSEQSPAGLQVAFSYDALLGAGVDSVFHSELYWKLHDLALNPGHMRVANPLHAPAFRESSVKSGFMFTHFMENHDEIRLASRHFAPSVSEQSKRAELGLAYFAYLALLPGHILIHGGQELQEDASIYGPFAGDNGRTSIFDYVYQKYTRMWIDEDAPSWMVYFRSRYKRLLELKKQPPFSRVHSQNFLTYFDLDAANWYKVQARHVAAYLRTDDETSYLVVTNSDPHEAHKVVLHFTDKSDRDSYGLLKAAGIENSDSKRYLFKEEFAKPGFIPKDPNIDGIGVPGKILYQSGGIPSGLYIGDIQAGTTMVFRIEQR